MNVIKNKAQVAKQEESLRKVFASNDEEKTIKAVKKLRETGNPAMIGPLLDLLSATENDNVFSTVVSLLNDLKDQDAAAPLIDALNDEKYEGIRVFILQVFWQSRLDALPYLDEIVNLAVKSDYMVCLECLTILESFKTAPTDEQIVEANTQIKDAIMDNSENKDLLLGMIEALNNYMIG